MATKTAKTKESRPRQIIVGDLTATILDEESIHIYAGLCPDKFLDAEQARKLGKRLIEMADFIG